MEPFEKRVRNLPWRKPPDTLKERIFAADSPSIRHSPFRHFFQGPIARAALLFIPIGLIAFTLHRFQNPSNTPSPLAQNEVFVIETQEDDPSFFDLTSNSEDLWPGTLTLIVEAN